MCAPRFLWDACYFTVHNNFWSSKVGERYNFIASATRITSIYVNIIVSVCIGVAITITQNKCLSFFSLSQFLINLVGSEVVVPLEKDSFTFNSVYAVHLKMGNPMLKVSWRLVFVGHNLQSNRRSHIEPVHTQTTAVCLHRDRVLIFIYFSDWELFYATTFCGPS